MLSAKKRSLDAYPATSVSYRKRLDYLYARRSTIDTLIESLMAYELSRTKVTETRRRKSA